MRSRGHEDYKYGSFLIIEPRGGTVMAKTAETLMNGNGECKKSEFENTLIALFRWQGPYEGQRELDPAGQLLIAVDPIFPNDNPAFHWSTGEIHLADIRFRQCNLGLLDTQSRDQRVIPDGDQHVPVQEEAHSTEHLLFGDPPTSGKHVSNSFHE